MEYKRINMRMPMPLYELVVEESKKTGVSFTALMIVAVKEYMKTNSILDFTKMYQSQLMDKPTE